MYDLTPQQRDLLIEQIKERVAAAGYADIYSVYNDTKVQIGRGDFGDISDHDRKSVPLYLVNKDPRYTAIDRNGMFEVRLDPNFEINKSIRQTNRVQKVALVITTISAVVSAYAAYKSYQVAEITYKEGKKINDRAEIYPTQQRSTPQVEVAAPRASISDTIFPTDILSK